MAKPRPHSKHAPRAREIAGTVLKADPHGDSEQAAHDAWMADLTDEDLRQLGRNMKAYMDAKQKT